LRAQGKVIRVKDLGFRFLVLVSGFKGLRFRVQGLRFMVKGLEFGITV
jgi:hypothetical protein